MPEAPTTSAGAPAAEAPVAKSKSKVKIAGIVGGIVVLQCLLAYVYLPGGGDAAKAEAKKDAAAPHTAEAEAADGKAEAREVDLGKFSLTAFDPSSTTTMLIDFHLYGTVAIDRNEKEEKGAHGEGHGGHGGKAGEGGEEDNSTFGKMFKRNRYRFRDQVIVIIRNAPMSDLQDPGLGLIKRQILAKTNSLLGEPLLKEVLFSDFAVVQQ